MYDVLIIGCGITGAACAYELSKRDMKLCVLERENDVSMGATRANSAILHAGYDPKPGTLAARLNVRGAYLAEKLCAELDVPYKKCGSLVLAFDDSEADTVRMLYDRGIQNGVPGLEIWDRDILRREEPTVSDAAVCALYAPSAAIVSPWEYCLALAETAVRNGAEVHTNSEVTNIAREGGAWRVTAGGRDYLARFVINAAGADAARVRALAAPCDYRILPARGEYFLLDKCECARARHVIFQCPNALGKGVLVAPTVHGNLIVGPNAQPSESTANTAEGLEFVRERAKKSVPGIDFRKNIRNFAGVRPNGDRGDFIIEWAAEGMLDLAGIGSPGLTAAPAIAEYACELLQSAGLNMPDKQDFISTRRHVRFAQLPPEEKKRLISENPAYGHVVCRCETITEGEILDALASPIPPVSIDGIKRRAGTGMGRCQGGFCGPQIANILSRELGIAMTQVLQDGAGTNVLVDREGTDIEYV